MQEPSTLTPAERFLVEWDRISGAAALRKQLRAEAERDAAISYAAMLLSPTLEICEALLRGEYVPRSRLNREYLPLLRRWIRSTD